MRWLAMAVSGVALASCAPNGALPGIKDRSTLSIVLVRSGPHYAVEIKGDGTATYCGVHFVDQVGERTRHVSEASLFELVERFHELNFFDLRNEYVANKLHSPMYTVVIRYDGKEKVVVDEVGEEVGMPAAVTDLQDAIDRVAGTSEWVGVGSRGFASEWPKCGTKYFNPPEPMPPAPL